MILARFSNELLEAKCGVVWETTISESFSPKGIHTTDFLRAHEQEWWQNESLQKAYFVIQIWKKVTVLMWTKLSPSKSYTEVLTPDVMAFGDKVFGR